MSPQYYYRSTDIRRILAPEYVQVKLADEHPIIRPSHEVTGRFVVATEGPRMIDAFTDPCGVVFTDESFLTLYEEWHKSEDKLLAYSYHYQRSDLFLRYDMEEKQKGNLPRYHVQTSGLEGIHAPCGGRVAIEQVLDMIVRQFL